MSQNFQRELRAFGFHSLKQTIDWLNLLPQENHNMDF